MAQIRRSDGEAEDKENRTKVLRRKLRLMRDGLVDQQLAAPRQGPQHTMGEAEERKKMNLPQSAIEWLAHGKRGMSSNTIFQTLTGIDTGSAGAFPWDPDDFTRCEKLLTAVPEFRSRMGEVAAISKQWAALVSNWDKIKALIEEEAPEWDKGIGSAPKAYRLMKELLGDG